MTDAISEFRKFVDLIEGRAMACDGPVTPFLEELNAASDEEKKRFTAILAAIYKIDPPKKASEHLDEGKLLGALFVNYWDLRCINVPTSGGDCDVDWIVVEHHMADPQERTIAQAYVDDPRVAIRRALRSIDKNAARCVVCDEVIHDGDSVYYEHGEGGHLHAYCASDDPESFVDVDEVPLKAGDPIPEPFAYSVEKYEAA